MTKKKPTKKPRARSRQDLEVKPCPCCGSSPFYWDESIEHQAGVGCHKCGLKIHRKHSVMEAIKAWNKRKAPSKWYKPIY